MEYRLHIHVNKMLMNTYMNILGKLVKLNKWTL